MNQRLSDSLKNWMIHEHLKKESPFSRTVMITHANDRVGYMPDDAALDQVSNEITTSRFLAVDGATAGACL